MYRLIFELRAETIVLELLDNLRNQNTKSAPEFVIDHCATMACKAAVKGNHTMSYAEARELIGQMLQMDQPYHCPHGRPTTIAMSQYEFEKNSNVCFECQKECMDMKNQLLF